MIQRTRVGAYGLVVDGTRVLLTKLAYSADAGTWNLPGGGIEHGETPEEALVREVREEAGIEVVAPSLLTVLTSRTTWKRTHEGGEDEDIHSILIVFRATAAGGALKADGDGGSCAGAAWIEIADLPRAPLSRGATRVLREQKLLP